MECGWFMVVMLSLSFPAEAAKPANSATGPIERVLDFSTEPSAKSLKAVEHAYRSLAPAVRGKPQVNYAYAVALIRQRRFQEAGRVVEELGSNSPPTWPCGAQKSGSHCSSTNGRAP